MKWIRTLFSSKKHKRYFVSYVVSYKQGLTYPVYCNCMVDLEKFDEYQDVVNLQEQINQQKHSGIAIIVIVNIKEIL